MDRSLNNKIVVVTGGGSGIGKALCSEFGNRGAKIVVLDIDKDGADKTAANLRDSGVEAISFRCDVSDEKEANNVISEIILKFGGIDILFNNAGITLRSSFRETDLDVYKRIFDINFFGTLNCTKPALDSIIERKGSIVITSSIAGVSPLLGRTGYAASKHALHGFFESLRAELSDSGVHIMMLCPGFTKTDLQSKALGGDGKVTDRPQSKTGKVDSPERVAEKVYRGFLKRKRIIVLTPVGVMTYWLSRLIPSLYEKIMISKLKDELKRSS